MMIAMAKTSVSATAAASQRKNSRSETIAMDVTASHLFPQFRRAEVNKRIFLSDASANRAP